MTEQEAREYLERLARETGASVNPGDVADLTRRNPEDVAEVMRAFEDQYERRGASTAHRAHDSQSGYYDNSDPRSEPGYGVSEGTYQGSAPLSQFGWGGGGSWFSRAGGGRGPLRLDEGGAFAPWAMANYGSPSAVPYTPFTREFRPSLGDFPGDLMTPVTDRFTPPDMPSDLMDRFGRTFAAPDPRDILTNPVVRARVDLGMDAIQRGAAARGTLLTPGVQMGIADYAGRVGSDEYANIWDRARSEFLDAYGIFTGDRTRRQGVWNDQYSQGAGAFNLNTGLRLSDRAQRAGIYGDQWMRDFGRFGQDYTIHRQNQLDPFGMGVQTHQLGQEDRRLGQADRALDENLTMGAFNRGRATYLDDWNIWHQLDEDYYSRLFRQAELGRP